MQTWAPASKPVLTQMVQLHSSWKQSWARGMDAPENRRQERRRYPNGETAERLEIVTKEPELPDPGKSTLICCQLIWVWLLYARRVEKSGDNSGSPLCFAGAIGA
ncbi:hypothetical protein SBA3_2780006 [Candidatus Sulfopaludibacter sp. SbA3]|nr:hypothetical protein SBA3_2780006 [Candidatus Sulfopaludibacter sp. SbA3]